MKVTKVEFLAAGEACKALNLLQAYKTELLIVLGSGLWVP